MFYVEDAGRRDGIGDTSLLTARWLRAFSHTPGRLRRYARIALTKCYKGQSSSAKVIPWSICQPVRSKLIIQRSPARLAI